MAVRAGFTLTPTFALYDPSYSRPTLLSGQTFTTGMSLISQDGGSFASTTNVPAEIDSSGVYALTLTAAEMNGAFITIKIIPPIGDVIVDRIATNAAPNGTAVTGTLTASSFTTSLTTSTADYWKDCLILFATGSLAGQVKKVSGYTVTGGVIAVATAFTGAPSNGDRFVLLNE